MQTEAIFENISASIAEEIRKAQQSVFIAVAWFTNQNLFNELLEKAKAGCAVSLIISNDAINANSRIDFKQLKLFPGCNVYKVGNGDTELMHNKFCVIDHSTVITGSYNWSYKAEKSNFENIIITQGDTALAEQFIAEFQQIRKRFFPDAAKTGAEESPADKEFPLDKIIRRLEILKNYILLEEMEELEQSAAKLSEYSFNDGLREIIIDLRTKEFAAAITKIQQFVSANQQLSAWHDPEISALKFEIKNLENQLNAFDNEKTELEKILSDFQHRHTTELGNIILEILKLRKLKYKPVDKEKYEEAENDEKEYRNHVKEESHKKQFALTDEEKQTLKKQFRKATVLCHPDKVSEEFQSAAQSIFVELKSAYDANDLKKVNEILADLEQGNYFRPKSESITQKDKLKAAISQLKRQVKMLEEEIIAIKQSETFMTINAIEDLDTYFSNLKQQLENELEELQKEVKPEQLPI